MLWGHWLYTENSIDLVAAFKESIRCEDNEVYYDNFQMFEAVKAWTLMDSQGSPFVVAEEINKTQACFDNEKEVIKTVEEIYKSESEILSGSDDE